MLTHSWDAAGKNGACEEYEADASLETYRWCN